MKLKYEEGGSIAVQTAKLLLIGAKLACVRVLALPPWFFW